MYLIMTRKLVYLILMKLHLIKLKNIYLKIKYNNKDLNLINK